MKHEYLDDEDAMRPLIHRAAGRGDEKTVSAILGKDPDAIHCRNELGNQPLHEACWEKHTAVYPAARKSKPARARTGRPRQVNEALGQGR
jgi:hypothetical protein